MEKFYLSYDLIQRAMTKRVCLCLMNNEKFVQWFKKNFTSAELMETTGTF